jgi:23S rRNA (guanosine2251-2'-O)-methyltransferase
MESLYGTSFHSSSGMPLFVLDNFRSAYNVGSVFRTAESVYPAGVLLTGITVRPGSRKLARTARGTQATVPWRYFDTPSEAVDWAKGTGRTVVAVESGTPGSVPLHMAGFPVSSAFVLGNEALGVSEAVLEAADMLVHVPQSGERNCMNVSGVAAVLAWEIQRRRLATAGHPEYLP